jgi:hypothetical protein
MTPEEKRTEKIKLMQLLRKGEIDTLPDVDSDAYKASKIKDMMSKANTNKSNIEELTGSTFERMDGLVSQTLLKKFLNTFEEIYDDYHEGGDPFDSSEVADYLSIMMQNHARDTRLDSKMFENSEEVNEGDPIVDEHEFNFFQTLFTPKYSEEEIEAFLKSDDYQEELKYSDLEEKDFANWDNALDMFVHSADRRGGRLDEGVEWMKRFSGVK